MCSKPSYIISDVWESCNMCTYKCFVCILNLFTNKHVHRNKNDKKHG